jgi:hypothetical protein
MQRGPNLPRENHISTNAWRSDASGASRPYCSLATGPLGHPQWRCRVVKCHVNRALSDTGGDGHPSAPRHDLQIHTTLRCLLAATKRWENVACAAVRRALQAAGIEFIDENGGGTAAIADLVLPLATTLPRAARVKQVVSMSVRIEAVARTKEAGLILTQARQSWLWFRRARLQFQAHREAPQARVVLPLEAKPMPHTKPRRRYRG